MKGYTSKQSVSRKRNQTNTPHSTLDTALALLPTTLHQREDVHVATLLRNHYTSLPRLALTS